MIDIHCHILPEVDDGARTLEDSLAMARKAVNEGIHTIIATPHHKNSQFENPKENILEKVIMLNEKLSQENIPLKVLPGQEPRINGTLVEDYEAGEILTLAEGKYIFVELPTAHVPRYTERLLYDVQVKGLMPIIVHPERNQEIIKNPDLLYKLVKNGTMTQITAASICGKFGKNIRKFTEQLVDANLTHFIASDAHNITSRSFCFQEALDEIKTSYGSDMVYYFTENAELLILSDGCRYR